MARKFCLAALLVVMTLAVFGQTATHQFLNFDDADYLVQNPHIQQGIGAESVRWAFTTRFSGNWLPLTWLSHMADFRLYGMNAGGHLMTSLLFHVLNTLLLFFLLRSLTGSDWKSFFTAALFAVHPLHVESVAWAIERKDVLSVFFGLLSLGAYARYARRASVPQYGLALLFFACSLMSKAMLVTLPFLLFLLDYWPLERSAKPGKIILEKIPFLLLSVCAGLITVFAQHERGSIGSLDRYPLAERFSNTAVSYAVYIKKIFWPFDLAAFYPFPLTARPWYQPVFAALLMAAVSLFALALARRKKYVLTGWLWYLGTLVPVIGLVQVGNQAFADRYTYFPAVGIFILLVWGVCDFFSPSARKPAALGVPGFAVLAVFSSLSFAQTAHWKNSVTLFTHALRVTKDNYFAHNNLGRALQDNGKTSEAEAHFRQALSIHPSYALANNNLGSLLAEEGKYEEAAGYFQKAIEEKPGYAEAQLNMGSVLLRLGRPAEAMPFVHAALKIRPDFSEALIAMGNVCARLGEYELADESLARALRLRPGDPLVLYNLGRVKAAQGRNEEAVMYYEKVLQIEPGDREARESLASLRQTGAEK